MRIPGHVEYVLSQRALIRNGFTWRFVELVTKQTQNFPTVFSPVEASERTHHQRNQCLLCFWQKLQMQHVKGSYGLENLVTYSFGKSYPSII